MLVGLFLSSVTNTNDWSALAEALPLMVMTPAFVGSILKNAPWVGRVPKGSSSENSVMSVSAVPSVDGICVGSKPALPACHDHVTSASSGEPSVTTTPLRVMVEPLLQPSADVAAHSDTDVSPKPMLPFSLTI